MEDISEDAEPPAPPRLAMRPANSEPSLAAAVKKAEAAPGMLCPNAAVLWSSGRRMMVTSSRGKLKAYSHDGVSPNLPVPFAAKFRRRARQCSDSVDPDDIVWSASMEVSFEDVCVDSKKTNDGKAVPPSRYPAAVEPTATASGDCQLAAILFWLAASVADLPFLLFYTAREPALSEMSRVYSKVLSREWTVGDLSCETLRFCRNKCSPKRSLYSKLFNQLLGNLSYDMSQQSLD